jgi:ABC-2 type transport system permease protein
MRGFFASVIMSFKSSIVFKINLLVGISRTIIAFLIQLAVWNALYFTTDGEPVAGRYLPDLITFTVISSIISILVGIRFAADLESRMKSGDIALDFVKPQPPRLLFVAQSLGSNLNALLFRGVPMLIAALFFLSDIRTPASAGHLALFLVSLAGAFFITASLELLTGTLTFWFINVWFLGWIMKIFTDLFSGRLVPLWFFPEFLRNISRLLPFQAAYFTPVEIYLGNYDISQSIEAIAVQLFWGAALCVIQQLMWRRAVKQIVVLGG